MSTDLDCRTKANKRTAFGVCFFVCIAAFGCTAPTDRAPTRELRVAAASDLKFALDDISVEFKAQHPGIAVNFTYGSSGNFFAQISNRAPFDLYMSADAEYPRQLVESGLAIKETMFTYAFGYLALWVLNASPLDLQTQGMNALLDPAVKKIAVANPQHAPYGRAAVAALKKLGIYDQLENKLVYGDNVAQAAQFVDVGVADIGVIPVSLAVAGPMRDRGRLFKVPVDTYSRLDQAGVILPWVQNREAADLFRAFVLSAAGQTVLLRYGFEIPGN